MLSNINKFQESRSKRELLTLITVAPSLDATSINPRRGGDLKKILAVGLLVLYSLRQQVLDFPTSK